MLTIRPIFFIYLSICLGSCSENRGTGGGQNENPSVALFCGSKLEEFILIDKPLHSYYQSDSMHSIKKCENARKCIIYPFLLSDVSMLGVGKHLVNKDIEFNIVYKKNGVMKFYSGESMKIYNNKNYEWYFEYDESLGVVTARNLNSGINYSICAGRYHFNDIGY